MDQLCDGLNQLIDNCDFIEGEIALLPGDSKLVSSQSSICGLSEFAVQSDIKSESHLKREHSIPDFRTLQKNSRSNKSLWNLSGFSDIEGVILSDPSDNDNDSLEWESPIHGWINKMHDKVDLDNEGNIRDSGDEVSSFGGSALDSLEWDSECLTQTLDTVMLGIKQHKLWLRDSLKDLDQQPKQEETLRLNESSQTSRSTSRQSLTDMRLFQRFPPSGSSSVERESIS